VRAAKILAAAPRPAEMSSTVRNCGASAPTQLKRRDSEGEH
jgi:hypothetical protein